MRNFFQAEFAQTVNSLNSYDRVAPIYCGTYVTMCIFTKNVFIVQAYCKTFNCVQCCKQFCFSKTFKANT